MTAPGNSIVLLLLLAAFLACTGYAGGRLHQWYRMGQDRDEAYRDGYDTATRSVFSMAARIISPRRADRAAIRASAAVVIPASSVIETSTSPLPPHASATPPDDHARPLTFRATPEESPSPAHRDTRSARSFSHEPPASRTGTDAASGPRSRKDGVSAARSGVDGASAARLGLDGVSAVRPSAGEAVAGQSGGGSVASDAEAGPESEGGRHLVPDELVQADTYRLPPDRVARAKVRKTATPPELAADPTWRLPPVPRPRSN